MHFQPHPIQETKKSVQSNPNDFHSIVSVSFRLFVAFSLGPLETLPREMVSRRKILSRSRDDLNLEHHQYVTQDDEEDIWYQSDKLYKVSYVLLPLSAGVTQTKRMRMVQLKNRLIELLTSSNY